MTETLPAGVKLQDWDDVNSRRQSIFDSVLNSFTSQFPQSYGGVRLEVSDLHYDGPDRFSIADQKRALLTNRYLHRKLKGNVRLVDEATGQPLEEKPMTLMKVPVLTDRGTFIHNGSEYTTMSQARLLPGVFTRRKATGELESHFNVRRGTGSSFRVHLEPDTGLFKMDIGQASLRLYSLLHDLGVPDDRLEAAWGPELLAKNKSKYDPRVFDKAYARLVRRSDPNLSREEKAKAILQAMQGAKLDRSVVDRTLPNLFNRKVAAVWKKGAVLQPQDLQSLPAGALPAATLPEELLSPVAIRDDKDKFTKNDYLLLAHFLNQQFGAAIPLTLATSDLVDAILAKLQELMPDFNPEMLRTMMQTKMAARDAGCLMAVLRPDEAAPIVNWSKENFPADDLILHGIEHTPHVTVRYGFPKGFNVDRLKKFLKGRGQIRFTLRDVTSFKGVEDGAADCLVVEVESEDLVRLRKELDEAFSATLDESKHRAYKPHLTLAYVRKGTCSDLVGHAWFSGGTYVMDELVYSTPGSSEKTTLALT